MNKFIASLLIFLAGLGAGYLWGKNSHQESLPKTENDASDYAEESGHSKKKVFEENNKPESEPTENEFEISDSRKIPAKVLKVLEYIKENGEAPQGYVGGRKFKNLEGLLPKKNTSNDRINYQEWDVNPKIDGKNRGRERLVTGDDKSAYFTEDHYQSFKKIK